MFPAESAAKPETSPIDALMAAIGVGGGAPPATVEIVYCCPKAALDRSKPRPTGLVKTEFLTDMPVDYNTPENGMHRST